MAKRFIDQFDVILLDLGHTFMFDADQFGDPEAFVRTYAAVGGRTLAPDRVKEVLDQLIARTFALYPDERYMERFPSVLEVLREVPSATGLAEEELGYLAAVFARHEIGTVTDEYIDILKALRKTHRLGLVSNIFSPSDLFVRLFEERGLRPLFDVLVFSSDVGAIKPSPTIFEQALRAFECPRCRIVHVGDRFERDVTGAKSVGIGAVWITAEPVPPPGACCRPDCTVTDLRELLTLPEDKP